MTDSQGKPRPGFISRLKGRKDTRPEAGSEPGNEKRHSKRVTLPIPVRLSIGGGDYERLRLRDASLTGLFLDGVSDGRPGEVALVHFEGYPDICRAFSLTGTIVRVEESGTSGLGVRINREDAPAEALAQYRKLVLHYIRHRPLLEEVDKGYLEGKCESCGWIGRVGARSPVCAKCGGRVVAVAKG